LSSSELEYINPYNGDEITDEELDTFCLRNKAVLTRKELHEIYQQKLLQDKQFLYEVFESDFDIDTELLVDIKRKCSADNFDESEYLKQREELVMKNLQRVSRRSQNSDHWKCSDCRITADVHFMYQHECSESRLKKKKSKESKTKTKAKAKDKNFVQRKEKQTVFWVGNRQRKDTPPSVSAYSGPAWLTQTYPNNNCKNNEWRVSHYPSGGASNKI
jgi:hypothetical protein